MRIITGLARGVKLKSPKGVNTRPTADRIKESLFNILGNELIDKDVLDLFSGTGNLALESVSRGAKSAICVDKDFQSVNIIKENIIYTKMQDKVSIIKNDIRKAIQILFVEKKEFDIIFSDPPYLQNFCQITLDLLNEYSILKRDGLIILEHSIDDILPEIVGKFTMVRNKKYGKTTQISFYKIEI